MPLYEYLDAYPELQLLITTNVISFLLGWVLCGEFGYISRLSKGSYLFLKRLKTPSYITIENRTSGETSTETLSEISDRTSSKVSSEIRKNSKIDQNGQTERVEQADQNCQIGQIEDIFDDAVRSSITDDNNSFLLKEGSVNEENEILNIGLSKKPTINIGGFYKFNSSNYARAADIHEREDAFQRSKLTPEENKKLTKYWNEKVQGKTIDEASKIIEEKGYIPHIYRVNNGPEIASSSFDPTKVNLHVKTYSSIMKELICSDKYVFQVESMGGI